MICEKKRGKQSKKTARDFRQEKARHSYRLGATGDTSTRKKGKCRQLCIRKQNHDRKITNLKNKTKHWRQTQKHDNKKNVCEGKKNQS